MVATALIPIHDLNRFADSNKRIQSNIYSTLFTKMVVETNKT